MFMQDPRVSGRKFTDSMREIGDEAENEFVWSVFPERNQVHFVIAGSAEIGTEANGGIRVKRGIRRTRDLIGSQKERTVLPPGETGQIFDENRIDAVRAAETQWNGKLGPDNEIGALSACFPAEFDMAVEKAENLLVTLGAP